MNAGDSKIDVLLTCKAADQSGSSTAQVRKLGEEKHIKSIHLQERGQTLIIPALVISPSSMSMSYRQKAGKDK